MTDDERDQLASEALDLPVDGLPDGVPDDVIARRDQMAVARERLRDRGDEPPPQALDDMVRVAMHARDTTSPGVPRRRRPPLPTPALLAAAALLLVVLGTYAVFAGTHQGGDEASSGDEAASLAERSVEDPGAGATQDDAGGSAESEADASAPSSAVPPSTSSPTPIWPQVSSTGAPPSSPPTGSGDSRPGRGIGAVVGRALRDAAARDG